MSYIKFKGLVNNSSINELTVSREANFKRSRPLHTIFKRPHRHSLAGRMQSGYPDVNIRHEGACR